MNVLGSLGIFYVILIFILFLLAVIGGIVAIVLVCSKGGNANVETEPAVVRNVYMSSNSNGSSTYMTYYAVFYLERRGAEMHFALPHEEWVQLRAGMKGLLSHSGNVYRRFLWDKNFSY